MHRRLAAYFDRKNCLSVDELADETLARVAHKLQEKGEITDLSPAHYCYIVAKFVFLEHLRHAQHGAASLEEYSAAGQPVPASAVTALADLASGENERLLDCLDRCLEKLPAADSQLILAYYQGERQEKIERRRQLGARLGLSANALSIRACRIRDKVEACLKECCAQE